ncbi:MAG: hypothetical protein RSA10_02455 [Bacilli bacterium]
MIEESKKLIILKEMSINKKINGPKTFIKFLDDDKKFALFYLPLIAPKNMKSYMKENGIVEGIEVIDLETLNNNQDIIYTFSKSNGVYEVMKGIEQNKKYVLLFDDGMNLSLDLPKYSYTIINNTLYIEPYKNSFKNICYVANDSEVSPILKQFMIETIEEIPNILTIAKKSQTNPTIIKKRIKR